MSTRAHEILMVEDDKEQADLIMDTAKVCGFEVKWSLAGDGEAALKRLRQEGQFQLAVRPALVLLDLHLPKLGGVEVLKTVKGDPRLKGIPVIIMSSSRDEADVNAAYECGANCYIGKPASFEGFVSMIKFLDAFLCLPQAEPKPKPTLIRAPTLN